LIASVLVQFISLIFRCQLLTFLDKFVLVRIVAKDALLCSCPNDLGQIVLIVSHNILLQLVRCDLLGYSDQRFKINLLFIFAHDCLVNEVAF
jgi:hypothetical protein